MTAISNDLANTLNSRNTGGLVGNQAMDQTAFLKLFTTQLKNQDPFEPMDNSQMVAQMAQFSSLQGITEMNAKLKDIGNQLAGNRLSAASSWIGRSMLVPSNIATPSTMGNYGGQIRIDAPSEGLSVDLVSSSGEVVQTIDLGPQAAGTVPFFWDGTDGAGNVLASDALQVKVRGANPSQLATWATVAAVQSPADAGSTRLVTALGSFRPEEALSIG